MSWYIFPRQGEHCICSGNGLAMSALYPEMRWDPLYSCLAMSYQHIQNVISRYEVWKAPFQSVTDHTIIGACQQNQFYRLDFWNLPNTFKLAYSRSHPNPTWPSFPRNKSNSGWSQHPKFKTKGQNPKLVTQLKISKLILSNSVFCRYLRNIWIAPVWYQYFIAMLSLYL